MVEKKNPCFECLGEVATFVAKLGERECRPLPCVRERGGYILAQKGRERERTTACTSFRVPLGLTLVS